MTGMFSQPALLICLNMIWFAISLEEFVRYPTNAFHAAVSSIGLIWSCIFIGIEIAEWLGVFPKFFN